MFPSLPSEAALTFPIRVVVADNDPPHAIEDLIAFGCDSKEVATLALADYRSWALHRRIRRWLVTLGIVWSLAGGAAAGAVAGLAHLETKSKPSPVHQRRDGTF
jgi:hypothetical protein